MTHYPQWPAEIMHAALTPFAHHRILRNTHVLRLFGTNTFHLARTQSLEPFPGKPPTTYLNPNHQNAFTLALDFLHGIREFQANPSTKPINHPTNNPPKPLKSVSFL